MLMSISFQASKMIKHGWKAKAYYTDTKMYTNKYANRVLTELGPVEDNPEYFL